MLWLALEDRILVRDELWGLVGLGIAPFFDYGGAWYADEPARLGGDVGLALRMGPTRSVHGDVAEFAVGYRFGQAWTGRSSRSPCATAWCSSHDTRAVPSRRAADDRLDRP